MKFNYYKCCNIPNAIENSNCRINQFYPGSKTCENQSRSSKTPQQMMDEAQQAQDAKTEEDKIKDNNGYYGDLLAHAYHHIDKPDSLIVWDENTPRTNPPGKDDIDKVYVTKGAKLKICQHVPAHGYGKCLSIKPGSYYEGKYLKNFGFDNAGHNGVSYQKLEWDWEKILKNELERRICVGIYKNENKSSWNKQVCGKMTETDRGIEIMKYCIDENMKVQDPEFCTKDKMDKYLPIYCANNLNADACKKWAAEGGEVAADAINQFCDGDLENSNCRCWDTARFEKYKDNYRKACNENPECLAYVETLNRPDCIWKECQESSNVHNYNKNKEPCPKSGQVDICGSKINKENIHYMDIGRACRNWSPDSDGDEEISFEVNPDIIEEEEQPPPPPKPEDDIPIMLIFAVAIIFMIMILGVILII